MKANILKINSKYINLENMCRAIVCAYICVLFAFYEIRLYFEFAFIILLSLYFIVKKKKLTVYAAWGFFFVGICMLSNIWTETPTKSFLGARAVLEIAVICNLLIAFIDDEEKLFFLYKIFIISGLILIISLLIRFPISTWGSKRIGDSYYNANFIGMHLAISSICAFQIAMLRKRKMNYLFILIFFTVILLTGSRKAFFMVFIGIAVLYYINGKKVSRKILSIVLTIIAVMAGYKLIMDVPYFYSVLGRRVETFFNLFTGRGDIDNSSMVRMNMISTGIDLLKEKPLLGHGIASYSEIAGFNGMYSHNNYIELLVGIGILGTAIYYYIYAYVIKKLLKLRKRKIFNGLLVIISLFVIMEYGFVSYYSEIYQMIIAISVSAIKIANISKIQYVLTTIKRGAFL